MYTIYALIDPRDYSAHYVGVSRDVYRRFVEHISCKGENTAKDRWIQELQQLNLLVMMQPLGTAATREEALQIEAQWIHDYQSAGIVLFNKDKMPLTEEEPVHAPEKLAVYNGHKTGMGRHHTAAEVDDILDEYLQTGELPNYVSERQRRDYRKHPRLEERRKLLRLAQEAR